MKLEIFHGIPIIKHKNKITRSFISDIFLIFYTWLWKQFFFPCCLLSYFLLSSFFMCSKVLFPKSSNNLVQKKKKEMSLYKILLTSMRIDLQWEWHFYVQQFVWGSSKQPSSAFLAVKGKWQEVKVWAFDSRWGKGMFTNKGGTFCSTHPICPESSPGTGTGSQLQLPCFVGLLN